jgi:two-component system, OmpR family, sensor kinase
LAACIAVATALAVLSVLFYVVLKHRLDRDANDTLRSRAQAVLATVAVRHGRVAIGESPRDALVDQRVWLFDSSGAVERPIAPDTVQRAARQLAAAGASARRDAGADTRLLAEPINEHGMRVGMVVTAVSLAPYEHTQHIALIAVLVLDAVILLVFLVCARVLVRRALSPVGWMTEQAKDWSEHDLDRRFALGTPHDELTSLAATLDGLLGRLGASLRHEQRFSAEVAHQLRTPLTSLRGEAELALRRGRPGEMRDALQAVLRQTDRMAQVVDTLVTAAQRDADPNQGTVSGREAAVAAVGACEALAEERGVELDVGHAGQPVVVDADPGTTTQILVPIIENALRYCRSRVRLEYAHEGEAVVFRVIDDGPGVRAEEADTIFDPGVRGSASDSTPGAGLGLALARRLARAAGGEVSAELAEAGGRFAIRLPAS